MNPVIIGNATLYFGDCRDILPTLGKVDAVVTGLHGRKKAGNPKGKRTRGDEQPKRRFDGKWPTWPIEPDVGRVANGIPARMDRLKGLGNAVVPQIPELIGQAILESMK